MSQWQAARACQAPCGCHSTSVLLAGCKGKTGAAPWLAVARVLGESSDWWSRDPRFERIELRGIEEEDGWTAIQHPMELRCRETARRGLARIMSSRISCHRQGSGPRRSADFEVTCRLSTTFSVLVTIRFLVATPSSPKDACKSLRPEHPFSPTAQMEADSLMELTATSLQAVSAPGQRT